MSEHSTQPSPPLRKPPTPVLCRFYTSSPQGRPAGELRCVVTTNAGKTKEQDILLRSTRLSSAQIGMLQSLLELLSKEAEVRAQAVPVKHPRPTKRKTKK